MNAAAMDEAAATAYRWGKLLMSTSLHQSMAR
jgi:hypothetical protein